MANYTPKRKRRLSSSSSYLEPATFLAHTGIKANKPSPGMMSASRTSVEKSANSASQSPPISLNPPADISSAPEKRAKTYERGARRKTREDHYEVKSVKEGKKQGKEKKTKERKETNEGTDKKLRKRKCKEKSGDALMHDFTARNVTRERLTVSQNNCHESQEPCQYYYLISRIAQTNIDCRPVQQRPSIMASQKTRT